MPHQNREVMKKLLLLLSFSFILGLLAFPANGEEESSVTRLPGYTVIDEDVVDTPLKTHVAIDILVSGDITEKSLKMLLNKLYTSVGRRTFHYHKFPTNIYINAYTSYQSYQSKEDGWVGKLSKSYVDIEPRITVNPLFIPSEGGKGEEKFGLSEEVRKMIWKKTIEIEDAVYKEAERRYPPPSAPKPNISEYTPSVANKELSSRISFQDSEIERRINRLARQYGLKRDELQEIRDEGINRSWPYPNQ